MTRPHVLITGGSGLIGSHLTAKLLQEGYTVSHLGRGRHQVPGVRSFTWDPDQFTMEDGAIENAAVIVHLAGANVGDKRWTAARKHEILLSRTQSAALLAQVLESNANNVRTVIAASAIGYYGFDDNVQPYHEGSPEGNDFQARVTVAWEQALHALGNPLRRLVLLRTGVVLSREGGMVKEMAAPVKAWIGAPLGTGRQHISWIHIEDLCEIYLKAIADKTMEGTFNAVAPYPATNKQVTHAIARALHRPIWLPPVPGFLLKLFLGEMATLVLRGSNVSAEKILRHGFRFQHPDLQAAINDLLKR